MNKIGQIGSSFRELSILSALRAGLSSNEIMQRTGIKKKTLWNVLSSLKQQGLIKKVGYGVWEVVQEKQLPTTTHVAKDKIGVFGSSFPTDYVRGHAFQFTFALPKDLRNWDKREELLKQEGIPFEPLKILGGGQRLHFRSRKVWLTNKSIVIYEKTSYMAPTAAESKSTAIFDALSLLRALERHLHANFSPYKFKISRQHYALMKNALAKQYDKEGKKLQVYNEKGLWFVIDNSFALHEAETVHPKTSDDDNLKMQTYFNHIKNTPLEVLQQYSPQLMLNTVGTLAQNLDSYAVHLKAHVKSVQDLGANVIELGKGANTLIANVVELTSTIKELKEVIRK